MKKVLLFIILMILIALALFFFSSNEQSENLDIKIEHNHTSTDITELNNRYDIAEKALKETNIESAIELYEQILSDKPGDLKSLYGLGVSYSLSADYDKATEYLHEVFKNDSSYIKQALKDPTLFDLRGEESFHILLNMFDHEIPEMYPHISDQNLKNSEGDSLP